MFAGLRRAAMLLFLCLASAGGAPSKLPTKTSTAPVGKLKQVNGIPLALLSSAYVHVEDSGVGNTAPNRWAILLFHPSGAAFLMLGSGQPQEDKAYEGKFSYSRGLLTLRFASREFARSASFPLDLAGSEVTMLFRVFSAEKGTSKWKREGSDDRLLDNVGSLCDAIVLARQVDPEMATPLLAKYLEPFVHPAGTPEIDVSPAPRVFSMTSFRLCGDSIGVDLDDPEWGRHHIGGELYSCFHGPSSGTGSSPCTGREQMICTQEGCRCSAGQSGIRVVPGKTSVTGSCERADIDEVISRRFNEARYCYSVSLPRNSKLAGQVAASFNIDSAGAVSEAGLAQSTMNNDALEQCLLARIRRWKFPKPKGGGACTINCIFIFEATAEVD